MLIGVLVVEDETLNREFISTLVEAADGFSLLDACRDAAHACQSLAIHRPDVVLLDIQLPDGTGFSLLEDPAFTQWSPPPLVVFITAYDQYAVRAFEAHAADYVLKPFGRARLDEALGRVKQRLEQGQTTVALERMQALLKTMQATSADPVRLQVKEDGQIQFVPINEISWIESRRNYVRLNTKGRGYRLRDTLSSLEQRLSPHGFVRVHRSALVNLHHVRALEPWFHGGYILILKDDQRVKLSRRYTAAVRERLAGNP